MIGYINDNGIFVLKAFYDFIFYNSNDKYFNLTLEEDLFFTTTGIAYDNIDRDLFEDLIIGDEITITYDDRGHLNNSRIYNIEYKGRNYLNIEHVILEMSNNKKSSQTIGIALISITTVVGVCLFIWNCKTNKKSIQ